MNPPEEDRLLAARFQLLRLLGKGGLGEVWLAGDVAGQREVALKKLAARLSGDAARRELFEREFSIAQALVHPAILRPEEFFPDEDGPFFTMPVMPGGHLGERAGEPWAEAAGLLLPVCDALDYAHRKGVVHGDLKPSQHPAGRVRRAPPERLRRARGCAAPTADRASGGPAVRSPI